MIPSETAAKALWDKYALPEKKRVHVSLVARVCMFLADACEEKIPDCHIDKPLLLASALLHDIDKSILRKQGEQHPDTAVRILKEEGMGEVAGVVKTHSLHAIADPRIQPKTWEEKLLYLADKMVKQEIIGVDKRFALWQDEHLPPEAQAILERCYPQVVRLEKTILGSLGIHPADIAKLA